MKNTIHKLKIRRLSALLSLLAPCGLTVCSAAELPLAAVLEIETGISEKSGIDTEHSDSPKPEMEVSEVSAESSFQPKRLRDNLELLRLRYRSDFTYAMGLPDDISELLRTINQIKTETENDGTEQISPAVSDEDTEELFESTTESTSESTFGIFIQNDDLETENASEDSTTQTSKTSLESTAEYNLSLPSETLYEYDFNDAYRILYEFDFGSMSDKGTDKLELYSLKDYYQLRNFPLPALPKTIQLLERRLNNLIADYSGQWSVYIKNLNTQDELILNDEPMKSASVMKLFIMGTVYDAIEKKELERTQEVVDYLHNMISFSSNEDSNRLLSLLGKGSYADGIAKVNLYIAEHNFTGETHEYNGFEDPSTYCDPDHFNQVSAKDCGEILERIYRRTLGSRKVCNEIEEMMLNQNTRYKIPKGLPEGISVGNKTGEMDTAENDVAIIYGEKSDYILCVLSNDWDSKDDAIYHISEISKLVYEFFDDETYYQNFYMS